MVNVGAGAGSYEPADRYVVAVEPSAGMRAQRPATAVPALNASAESLPFDDGVFDAAMATVTVHQQRYGHLRTQPQFLGSLRLAVRRP